MDLLEDLIKEVLLDMTKAQDAANKYSARIAKQYQENGGTGLEDEAPNNLKYFQVPNAKVDSFEFTLKFALDSEATDEIIPDKVLEGLYQRTQTRWIEIEKEMKEQGIKVNLRKGDPFSFKKPKKSFPKDKESIRRLLQEMIKYAIKKEIDERIDPKSIDESYSNKILKDLNRDMEIWMQELHFDKIFSAKNLKAVFETTKLNNVNDEIICQIHVKASMGGLSWGYSDYQTDELDTESNSGRKSILI